MSGTTLVSKIRWPRKIRVGNFVEINVRYVVRSVMRDEAEVEEDEATPEGLWDDDVDTIYVGRWLSDKRKREVLLHELGHACWDYREHVGGTHETSS